VLGTLELLFRARDRDRTLPNVSPRLGHVVRTNSEAITAILSRDADSDLSRGPAISSHFYPDPSTRIFQNRLADNENFLRFHYGPLIDGERPGSRTRRTIASMLTHPARMLGVWGARNFTNRVSVLVAMQKLDNELAFRYGRLPTAPWRAGLRTAAMPGKAAPTYLPIANQATRAFAQASGGEPLNMLIESVANKSTTAHILGGAGRDRYPPRTVRPPRPVRRRRLRDPRARGTVRQPDRARQRGQARSARAHPPPGCARNTTSGGYEARSLTLATRIARGNCEQRPSRRLMRRAHVESLKPLTSVARNMPLPVSRGVSSSAPSVRPAMPQVSDVKFVSAASVPANDWRGLGVAGHGSQ
jgi:hypothetical protein